MESSLGSAERERIHRGELGFVEPIAPMPGPAAAPSARPASTARLAPPPPPPEIRLRPPTSWLARRRGGADVDLDRRTDRVPGVRGRATGAYRARRPRVARARGPRRCARARAAPDGVCVRRAHRAAVDL